MANDLLSRPGSQPNDDELNPADKKTRDQFDSITAPDNYDREGIPGELSGAEDDGGSASSSKGSKASSRRDLSAAENSTDTLGKGFTGAGASAVASAASAAAPAGRLAKAGKFFMGSKRRKQATFGGAIFGGGTIAGIVFFATMVLPLRLPTLVANLQNEAFATTESVVGDEANTLLDQYIARQLLPGMVTHKCTSTSVSKSCALVSKSKSPVGQLYNAWRDAHIENKFYTKYGIEIMRDGSNNFYFRSDKVQHKILLGQYSPGHTTEFENKIYSNMNRGEIRSEIRAAFAGESYWKQMMHRFGVGRLVEKKYGVRRCIVACKIVDKLDDKVADKKVAFKSYLNERVIKPRSQYFGLVISCAMKSFDCVKSAGVDPDGEHLTQFDKDGNRLLTINRSELGTHSLDDLTKDAKSLREKGLVGHLVGKVLGDSTGLLVGKAIPVIGWIDLAAKLQTGAAKAGPAIKHMSYVMNSVAAVQMYMLYRSSADEIKVGQTDATELGSINESLDASDKTDQGGMSAEQSPYYQSLFDSNTSQSNTSASLLNGLSADAYADSSTSNAKYTCDDGKPRAAGDKICPEERLDASGTIGAAADYLSSQQNPVMVYAASLWNHSLGWVYNAALNLAGGLAVSAVKLTIKAIGFGWVLKDAASIMNTIVKAVVSYIIPSPFTDNTSGARFVDIAGAGADVSANDYAHYGLGAHVVPDAVAAKMRDTELASAHKTFAQQSLFARMFDSDSPYSLISRIAVAMPSSTSSALTSFSSAILRNPFGAIINQFGAMFVPHSAFAAGSGATADVFGVKQYAYSSAEIAALGDQDEYWNKHCTDITAVNEDWGNNATQSDSTGMFDNYKSNPCLLIQGGVANAGGVYDTSLIPDYQADNGGVTAGGVTINIATYNMHGASHTDPLSGNSADDPNSPQRTARALKVMSDNDFDVIGLQEFENAQRNELLKDAGTTYDIYPKTAVYGTARTSVNSIIWKSARFKLVGGGTNTFTYFNGNKNQYPWVKLQDISTQQTFYVFNTHDPANTAQYHNQDKYRKADAVSHLKDIQAKLSDGSPVLFTGDFNSTFAARTAQERSFGRDAFPYCVLTSTGELVNTYDANGGNSNGGKCPTKSGGGIDHIYASKDVSVSDWARIKNADTDFASDHAPVVATVTFGQSSSTTASQSGWVWPISKADWSGPFGYNVWGSCGVKCRHEGIDMSGTANKNALAAHDGTVVSAEHVSWAGGDCKMQVLVKADGTNLWYGYQHLGKALVKAGDKVKAGQTVIGTVDPVGPTGACGSGSHLHFSIEKGPHVSAYADGAGKSDSGMPTYPPLCFLPIDTRHNDQGIAKDHLLGGTWCAKLVGKA